MSKHTRIGEYREMDVVETDLPPINTVTLGSQDPPIVLLHGWKKSLDSLRPLGELLSENRRVILVDLPGFGMSPLPLPASNDGGGWSTSDYAFRIKTLLGELGVEKCILAGHSFGGRISVRLAHAYPDLCEALVLIGSHGIPRERSSREKIRLAVIQNLVKLSKKCDSLFGTSLFKDHLAKRFGSTDYNAAGDLRKTLVKTVNEDLSDQARTIDKPTLLLWGQDDRETPPDIARKFQTLIRGSELIILPNKGHEPYADVGSHLLATYIEQFVSKRLGRA